MTNGRVESYNRVQKQRAEDIASVLAHYAKRAHKMGKAKRQEIDGYKFASKAEARRYEDLKLMERAGEIGMLEVHPKFKITINGVDVCYVIADFAYRSHLVPKRKVVEDVKSQRIGKDGKIKFSTDTRHSKIGRKLVLAVHGIEIVLVK